MTGYLATVQAALAMVLVLAVACGDNSKECGEGTDDIDGTCVAACGDGFRIDDTGACVPDDSQVCANGTILDPVLGQCVIDPAACQAGTVLIGGQCLDPTADDIVDLQEGAEPNGMGVSGETSLEPAGVIVLPASGPYVVHGTIVPADHDDDGFEDNDIDTYLMTVTGPTLLAVSADGVHGLAAGFVMLADVDPADPLATFRRLGLNVTGDTSRRQLFLPAAGTYLLAIADTRTLILDGSSAGTGAVVGAEDGKPAFEYFVSIEPLAIPTPTAMTVTGTVATSPPADTINGDVKFFTVAMGAGFNRVTLGIATKQALASFVVLANDELRTLANGRRNGTTVLPADAFVGGFQPADTCVVVIDPIMNHAVEPLSYGLVVNLATAVALPINGMVSAPEITANPTSFEQLTGFYLDVAADQIIGIALSFNQPVDAVLVDGARRVVSKFTYGPAGTAVRDTMTSYRGLLRFPVAGRYYFLVYEPAGTGPTMITATSRIAALPATPITVGAVLANRPIDNNFLSAPFSFAAEPATNPWLAFDVVGANTGASTVTFFEPATAYGRLDTLTIQTPATVVLDPDPTPIFEQPYPQAGGVINRIMLDDATADYIVRVHPTSTNPATAKTVTLDFRKRVVHDFMTVDAGQSATASGEMLTAGTPEQLYLVRTPAGNQLTITVDPIGAPPLNLQNLQFDLLDRDETSVRTVNAPGTNTSDVVQLVQAGAGWTAFSVTSSQPLLVTENYDVLVSVLAP